ncbi:MAG: hypothetical protein ACI83O_000073 [Patescibacteria group bacterium]|jgi:hypothetical protein
MTTIQISETTKRMLMIIKEKQKQSYDKVLQEILPQHINTKKSLAGKFSQLKNWSKEDRMDRANE